MSFNLRRRELLVMFAAMSAQIPWSSTRAQSQPKSLRQGQSLISRDRWDRLRSLASIDLGPAAAKDLANYLKGISQAAATTLFAADMASKSVHYIEADVKMQLKQMPVRCAGRLHFQCRIPESPDITSTEGY